MLAEGGDAEQLGQHAQWRLDASTGDDAERSVQLDAVAFLEKVEMLQWKGTLRELLQGASQEPDASFLSRGAASTAQSLGLQLVRWVRKPQGRFPTLKTLAGHSGSVVAVAFSPDGKSFVSGSHDNLVKMWNVATGAEVRILEQLR